ncbi:MAG: vitamin B12-dependent ribonucleotide reductase, partial [Planctomycetota bacterium]
TGFSFSQIRPKNDIVSTSHGYASGPISFLKVFNEATEAINQGGFRRGANMGVLRVDHPDILDFIRMKSEDKTISNFNISVGLTSEFMHALANDEEYELVNPHNNEVSHRLRATEVYNLIVELAWSNGEPGIIFLDTINHLNPTPHIGKIESTNPCGEQPLLPYEACNLGSINLGKMVSGGKVNFKKLRGVVRDSVHFLDNVIEVNRYPLKQIEAMCKGNRKVGLGVMGFADMLIQLGIAYNSEAAVDTARNVMKFIQQESHQMSSELAEKRSSFPNYKGSVYDRDNGKPMRNATVTTIAPTGTISIICNSSSGIEPLFAVSFIRNVMDNTHLIEVNPLFELIAKRYEFYTPELMEEIAETGSVQGNDQVPEPIQRIFATSHDIDPEWHVRIQAAFQEFTDNAVSKTVNFKHDATRDDVRKVYDMAYKMGCKGVTVYRDGSRSDQVLNISKVNNEEKESKEKDHTIPDGPHFGVSQPRPSVINGWTVRMKTGCGNLYVTINEDQHGTPFELFNHIGKAGGCAASQSEAIGRLISFAMRSGSDVKPIIQQLKGISCHSHVWGDQGKILSCADAIGKALERYLFMKKDCPQPVLSSIKGDAPEGYKKMQIESKGLMVRGACPICGGILSHEEGCVTCHSCGYSECS